MKHEDALSLVSAYVDGELSPEENRAFLEVYESSSELQLAVRREKQIKELLRTRIPKTRAPEHLRAKVLKLISENQSAQGQQQNSNRPRGNNYLLSIAAILLIGLFVAFYSNFFSGSVPDGVDEAGVVTASFTVEKLTYEHFSKNNGKALPAEVDLTNVAYVQEYLKENYNCRVTVPELEGAEFAGVVYADFYAGHHTPLLSYKVSDDDYIYIFAFPMKDIEQNNYLSRDDNAVRSIVNHDDVYIIDYDGLHVVSWKWHDVWYAGISHHDGEVLAAMLPH